MPKYICSTCEKSFDHKNDYTRHITKKFPCKKKESGSITNLILNDITLLHNITSNATEITSHLVEIPLDTIEENGDVNVFISSKINMCSDTINISTNDVSLSAIDSKFKCDYCLKTYSRKDVLIKHIKTNCKVKKQEDNKKEEIYQKLIRELDEVKKEKEELKNEIKELKKINNQLIITNNNTHIENQNVKTQNNTVNINLIAHGRENLDKIDVKYVLDALKRGTSSIPVIAECIHFNVKYPEYQNVYITNMNQKYGMVYDGKEWILKDKNTIIDDMYEKKYDFLDENFETIYTQLSESQQKAFKRFLDIHEKADTNKQFKKIINKIKQDLKFLMYNKKKIPIDNYNNILSIQ